MISLFPICTANQLLAQVGSERVEVSLTTGSPWPLSLTVIGFLAAAAFIFRCYWAGQSHGPLWACSLAMMRLTLVGILLFMLYGMVANEYRVERPRLIVLLDNSQSMQTIDSDSSGKTPRRLAPTERAQHPPPSKQPESRSRFENAKSILQTAILNPLHERYRIEIMSLTETIVEATTDNELDSLDALTSNVTDLQPTATSSRLGERLQQIFLNQRNDQPACIVLLSDGITTNGPTLSTVAGSSPDVPIFTVAFGSQAEGKDLELTNLFHEPVVFVGEQVDFNFVLRQSGHLHESARVRLVDVQAEAVVAETTVSIDGEEVPLRLTHSPPTAGTRSYLISTQLVDSHLNDTQIDKTPFDKTQSAIDPRSRTTDRSLSTTVEVRDESINVLLVQSSPSFEYRFLKSILERATSTSDQQRSPIMLTTVLQEADSDFESIDRTTQNMVPIGVEQWKEFDVLIFGDVDPELLGSTSAQEIVSTVMEEGRSILMVAGEQFLPFGYAESPISKLFPFESANLHRDAPRSQADHLELTPFGQTFKPLRLHDNPTVSHQTWHDLPVFWKFNSPPIYAGVRTLATFSSNHSPAMTYHFAGRGKVCFQYWDGAWRLRFRRRDELLSRYWMQMIRFLARNTSQNDALGKLSVVPERPTEGESIVVQLRMADDAGIDDPIDATLERDGVIERRLVLERQSPELGLYVSMSSALRHGNYLVRCRVPGLETAATLDFQVLSVENERFQLATDFTELSRTAALTGGKSYDQSSAERLAKDLPDGEFNRIESLSNRKIWNSPWFVFFFLIVLTLEWSMRRRLGML